MARQARIEYEGAFYHVTSRGNLRENVFFDNEDRERFIKILKRTKERYGYILHAFVLMDNHFHLLMETPAANLTQIMQNINTSYTVFINKKYNRSGHLFQGRYKAMVVEKESYLLALSRYIHLNPVKAGIVSMPEKYKWSSYREYLDNNCDEVVDITDTLSYFDDNKKQALKKYREFVESVIENKINPFEKVRAGIILGGNDFTNKIIEMLTSKGDEHLIPEKFHSGIPIDIIVNTVAGYYSLEDTCLRKKKTKKYSEQRKVAIYLSKIMSRCKNKVVAKFFGVSPQAVTNVIREIENSLEESIKLKKEIEKIKCIL